MGTFQFSYQALTESGRKRRRLWHAATTKEERDWSELPLDMLNLIFKKLSDLSDLARFRAVCWQWRSASSHLPPQFPWCFRSSEYCRYNMICKNYMDLYNPLFGGGPKIDFSQWCRKRLISSWHRYVLVFVLQNSSLSLLNPLTKKEIALPFIDIDWCRLICIRSDPVMNCEYVAIHGGKYNEGCSKLGFCRVGDEYWGVVVGDEYWKIVVLKNDDTFWSQVPVICLYNQMFFVHHRTTELTQVMDIASSSVKLTIPPPKDVQGGFEFFVESRGKLLGVTLLYKHRFLIHKLYENENNPQRVQTNNIGDQFLLLNQASSSGISLKTSDFPRVRSNCIYYVYRERIDRSYLVRFDITKSKAKILRKFPLDVEPVWFLPSLHKD